MSATTILSVLAGLALLVTGLRMWRRPNPYIGTGVPPASDPRTVAQFGLFFTVLGVVLLALNLLHFVTE